MFVGPCQRRDCLFYNLLRGLGLCSRALFPLFDKASMSWAHTRSIPRSCIFDMEWSGRLCGDAVVRLATRMMSPRRCLFCGARSPWPRTRALPDRTFCGGDG
jgi:hypothetical protein